jgi:hypothetical protein
LNFCHFYSILSFTNLINYPEPNVVEQAFKLTEHPFAYNDVIENEDTVTPDGVNCALDMLFGGAIELLPVYVTPLLPTYV